MKLCNKCGTQNPDANKFCANCGNPFNNQQGNTIQPQQPPNYHQQTSPYQQPQFQQQPPYPQPSVIIQEKKKGHGCLISVLVIVGIFIFLGIVGAIASSGDNSDNTNKSTTQSITVSEDEYKADCKKYTYTEIARNPNDYNGKQAVFTGQVIQVDENGNNITLRVNITGEYNEYSKKTTYTDTIYVEYERADENESRILEDDVITIYGELTGLKTYESIFGENISLPSLNARYIEIEE